jgi:glycosyltransferase involved in cell wall biosynthesis
VCAAPAPAPVVSVVVPTFRRPHLVVHAVASVLGQTLRNLEVVVVVDGRDEETCTALEQISDSRLRTLVPEQSLGSSEARNRGVAEARGEYIAFLDDDDEWFPEKLELQLATARRSRHSRPIVSCRVLARSETDEFVWPTRTPEEDEELSEYLYLRRTPFTGGGLVQTSTILVPRLLAAGVPFGVRPYADDPDWLLRAAALDGAGLEFVPEARPLVVWNIEDERRRLTRMRSWRAAVEWSRLAGSALTPRARTSFLLTQASAAAARDREWRAFFLLPREALRHHRPSLVDVITHVGNFLVPRRLQRRLAALYGNTRSTARPPADLG